MNDLPVIGYPCLRKELWDRQTGGKQSKSLERNVWRKVVSTSIRTISGGDQRFFAVVLKQTNLDSVWYVENVSFCMNTPKICDKTYRLAPLPALQAATILVAMASGKIFGD